MKNIIKLIAVAAALLPLGQLQAKTFGGFAPKKTFTLTVTTKFVSKAAAVGDSPSKVVPVPKGIVKLAVNETVKFTIGAKGQLIFKGLALPFNPALSKTGPNIYGNPQTNPAVQPARNVSDCSISNDPEAGPTSGKLKFYQTNGSGLKKTVTVVVYGLEKK
jgi:hypothetical protein